MLSSLPTDNIHLQAIVFHSSYLCDLTSTDRKSRSMYLVMSTVLLKE